MIKTQLDKLIREEIRKSLKEFKDKYGSTPMDKEVEGYIRSLKSAKEKKELNKPYFKKDVEGMANWLKDTADKAGVDLKKLFTEEIEEPTQPSDEKGDANIDAITKDLEDRESNFATIKTKDKLINLLSKIINKTDTRDAVRLEAIRKIMQDKLYLNP